MAEGIPVEKAEIIVTIDKTKSKILFAYNSISQGKIDLRNKIIISESEAYDKAWQKLKVHGQLIESPKINLSYQYSKGWLNKVYSVELSLTKPYGAWKVLINAISGEIISFQDQRITRRPKVDYNPKEYKGPITNRIEAFSNFYKKNLKKKKFLFSPLLSGDIPTSVFDPDPRTTLNNPDIEDDSIKEHFENAYQERVLKEVSFDGSSYSLKGPWVHILDYDPPNTLPHSSDEGIWMFRRGENPFNEAMTYFHIDQSQRYLQKLGFKGETGIQELPIEVDADGANGDDNSYFQPSTNRLSFGHGCVDDNEDADVILHEYGHAIQDSINPNWSGGDTGAMGEGFGDYWAATYSISTESGKDYFPNQVFSWDGHGTSNSCWNGRILNADTARYDHTKIYSAHVTIDGGFQSDELWSTPLFQSHLELLNLGVSREEIDKIVIQSHFGLGSGLKMRDMATATVETAGLLFPSGPHKEVFLKHFVKHGIIELPAPKIVIEDIQLTNDKNDFNNPGDQSKISFKIRNIGNLNAQNVVVKIKGQSELISVDGGEVKLDNLIQGEEYQSTNEVKVKISSATECGSVESIAFEIFYGQAEQTTQIYELQIGNPIGISYENSNRFEIPDNDENGVFSNIEINNQDFTVTDRLKIAVEIEHTYAGDLELILIDPLGDELSFYHRVGSSSDDIRGIFPDTLSPTTPFDSFIGKNYFGTWKLKVIDHGQQDVGAIESWAIRDIVRFECSIPE